MKLGAEPKKIAVLGSLLAVAAVVFYMNVLSDDDGGRGTTPSAGTPVAAPPKGPARPGSISRAASNVRRGTEFRPSLRQPEDRLIDPSKIDPTLHLEILKKLETATVSGSGRNIFEFGAPPPPPPAPKKEEPKIIPEPVKTPEQIAAEAEALKPKMPPIPLKFYGFISTPRGTSKRAFFLDGEEIVVGEEGDNIKQRYKIVRIGLNSVEMEDSQFNERQTLRMEEPPK